jgi:8-oxo-dGTP pyrophosphatase MutT (NUDIX family)
MIDEEAPEGDRTPGQGSRVEAIPTPARVAEALSRHPWRDLPPLPGRTNHLPAGVLIPLVWDPEPVAIVTLRASGLRRHAGEVSFPGGRPEPTDPDLEATALREAREEMGIDQARILGRLSSMPLYTSDFRLVPFVAEIPAGPLRPDPGEVARVMRIPLREVLEQPYLDGIAYEWEGRIDHSPVFVPGGHPMFGATAHTFYELLQVLAPLFGVRVPPLRGGRFTWEDFLGSTV